jgi:hypothetical protein
MLTDIDELNEVFEETRNTRDYRRFQRNRTVNRKRGILNRLHGIEHSYVAWRVSGKFAKGKIHCSCWMCSYKPYATNAFKAKHPKEQAKILTMITER